MKVLFAIAVMAAPVFGIFNAAPADMPPVVRPALTLEHVENRYDTYALYISYTGGHDREKNFYYRDSLTGDEYRLLPTMWGSDKPDAVGIITDEENGVLGHRMKLKVYFNRAAAERDVYINVIDENGNADTPPVHFKLMPREIMAPKPPARTVREVKAAPIPEKFRAYRDIALRTGGELFLPRSPAEIPAYIRSIIEKTAGGDIDIVFVIDDTGSMFDDAAVLKENISSLLDSLYKKHSAVRTGLLLYRDYSSEFLTKPFPFTAKRDEFIRNLNTMKTTGGDDEPEAVLEAVEAALTSFEFKASKRVIVVMGDAPPHEKSLPKVDALITKAKGSGLDVKVFLLGLPGDTGVPQKDTKLPTPKKENTTAAKAHHTEPVMAPKAVAPIATNTMKKPPVTETKPVTKTEPVTIETKPAGTTDGGDTGAEPKVKTETSERSPQNDTMNGMDTKNTEEKTVPRSEENTDKKEGPPVSTPKKEEPKKEIPPANKKPAVRSPDNADW